MTLFGSRRFTLGTIAVVVHGVVRNKSWVLGVNRNTAGPYQYKVEVEDLVGNARKGEVVVRMTGGIQRLVLIPNDPARMSIHRFLARPEIVDSDLQHSSANRDGDQDIDVDVTLEYPAQTSQGSGRNRVKVTF